ncbi:MAG: biosynthetic peptidoglycan transglycosylase, partial [Cytophagales bacterium]
MEFIKKAFNFIFSIAKLLFHRFMHFRVKFLNYFNRNAITKSWKYFIYIVFGIWLYVFSVEINFLWLFGKMPSIEKLENPKVDLASEIYTSDGVKIGKYFIENRTPVDYHQISPYVINALVAVEDIRFYEHSGIDMQAVFSVFYNLVSGGQKRGGSTITQQLAKNLFKVRGESSMGLLGFVPGLNTLIVKTKEWILSVRLEKSYTKQEIITMYLNTVDFGSRAFGIKTASQTYFNTHPSKLNIQEAAMLVGLLKATTTYSPILNPKNSLARRNVVLDQMAKYGIAEQSLVDSVSKLPIELKYYV